MSEDTSNLLDIDLREETEGAQDRRQLEGETIDRNGVSWVKNYSELMAPEELEKSRAIRARFENKFIEYPYSWWGEMTTRDQERLHLDNIVDDKIGKETYDDTWSVRDSHQNPALSQFPSKVAKQIIQMWSIPGDKIWDPFMGHFTRPILSNYFDRDYWGQDISKEYFEVTKQDIIDRCEGGLLEDQIIADEEGLLEVEMNNNWIKMENKDSTDSGNVPDEWAHFTMTSPPYFDLEFYGPEDDQLGNRNDEFDDFMDDMEEILEHNFRILKEGCYATYVVNDFRDGCMEAGVGLTPYHVELINKAQNVGFTVQDINMYKTGVSGGMFVKQLAHMEITGKIHEYVCTFRKPRTDSRGNKLDWKPRGIHFDSYPRQDIIDEYGAEYFNEWVEMREDRGLDIERYLPYAEE